MATIIPAGIPITNVNIKIDSVVPNPSNKIFVRLSIFDISILFFLLFCNYNFSEKTLYIGQNLENLYINSKFEAEKSILESINSGLEAQIFRIGNITSRYTDGKFQINPTENSFANRFKSFVNISAVPNTVSNAYLEFTPVDLCTKAFILIMQNYIKDFSVFHLYNDKENPIHKHKDVSNHEDHYKSNNSELEF